MSDLDPNVLQADLPSPTVPTKNFSDSSTSILPAEITVVSAATNVEHSDTLISGLSASVAVLAESHSASNTSGRCLLNADQHELRAEILSSCVLWSDLLESGKVERISHSFPSLYRSVACLLFRFGTNVLRLVHEDGSAISMRRLELQNWIDKTSYVYGADTFKKESSEDHRDQGADIDSDASSQLAFSIGGDDGDALEALDVVMSLLMELAPSILSLATIERRPDEQPVSTRLDFRTSQPARSWISQVADKYKDAPQNLIDRLGEANWQRFCKLRLHQDKEIAAEYGHAKSVFHDSAIGASLADEVDDKKSAASHSSFASSTANESHHFNKVPPDPPEIALGQAFICSICNARITNIKNRIQWKLHVFEDLRPYICLFDDCNEYLLTFPSRRSWANHDITEHREKTVYQCWDCHDILGTQSEFRAHVEEKHPPRNPAQLNVIISASSRLQSDISAWNCPLCLQEDFATARKFTSHVCRHMEDIALSTVPREMYNSSEDESDTDSDAPHGVEGMELPVATMSQGTPLDHIVAETHTSKSLRPNVPYQQFYDHLRPQLEADNYPEAFINSRIEEEWRKLSIENRALWEERYQEQMRDYELQRDETIQSQQVLYPAGPLYQSPDPLTPFSKFEFAIDRNRARDQEERHGSVRRPARPQDALSRAFLLDLRERNDRLEVAILKHKLDKAAKLTIRQRRSATALFQGRPGLPPLKPSKSRPLPAVEEYEALVQDHGEFSSEARQSLYEFAHRYDLQLEKFKDTKARLERQVYAQVGQGSVQSRRVARRKRPILTVYIPPAKSVDIDFEDIELASRSASSRRRSYVRERPKPTYDGSDYPSPI